MPTVSVIIPTYNRADAVRRAVQSVLDQAFADHEIIVVDDGSTDGTGAAMAAFGARVTYVRQENRGPAAARNLGIRRSQGRFIAFLDDDDEFLAGKLEAQVAFMDASAEFGMTYTGVESVDESGMVVPDYYPTRLSGWIYRDIVFGCSVATPTVMVRREVLADVGPFDEELRIGEDMDMWRRISRRYPIGLIRTPLSRVYIHTGTFDPGPMLAGYGLFLRKAIADDPGLGRVLWRRGSAKAYGRYGRLIFWDGRFDRTLGRAGRRCWARRFFGASARSWPLDPRIWLLYELTFFPSSLLDRVRTLLDRFRKGGPPAQHAGNLQGGGT